MDVKLTYKAWQLGHVLEGHIKEKMIGEFQMWGEQIALLAQVVEMAGDGDHLDIGTMWGGSAILAAMVKQMLSLDGMVYTLDPLDVDFFHRHKWYITEDGGVRKPLPTAEQVLENFKRLGVEDRVVFKRATTLDWPFPKNWRPISALIDGAHDFDSVLADWLNCRAYCNFIVFHDYTEDSSWGGVRQVVDHNVLRDPDFEMIGRADTCIAFARRTHERGSGPEGT